MRKQTINLKDIDNRLAKCGLQQLGIFNPAEDDENLDGIASVVLVGPAEPQFWPIFSKSAEFNDSCENPLDRWSVRVINEIASELDATSYFPFMGPPFLPFYRWALKTGEAFRSPVGLLVHQKMGLFVSFRGALGFSQQLASLHQSHPSPCESCVKPCVTACPVDALSATGYRYIACKKTIRANDFDCMDGCWTRKACPVGQHNRLPIQSRFHMASLLGLARGPEPDNHEVVQWDE